MVVSIIITNFMVSKVLINQGSSTNILYWKTFQKFEVSPTTVYLHVSPLLSFASERVETRGYVDLISTFGQGQLSKSITIRYSLIDADSSYFALIGRKTLNELGVIISMPHLKIKFPTPDGRNCDREGISKASTKVLHRKPEDSTLSSHQGACQALPRSGWRYSSHKRGWRTSNLSPSYLLNKPRRWSRYRSTWWHFW